MTMTQGTITSEELHDLLSQRKLPRWNTAAVLATSVAAAILLSLMTPISGVAGTTVVAFVLFLVLQTWLSFAVEGSRYAIDRLASTFLVSALVAALVPLASILLTVLVRGFHAFNAGFLTSTMRNVSPRKPGGGILHALIGTVEQVAIAAAIGIPLGVLAAVYLVEFGNRSRLARSVSFFVDVMTGIPSIVAGLFVYTGLILTLGLQRSGFAAGIALAILMIPVVVRSTEEMLRLVPRDLREASYALGVPKYRTILRVVIPSASTGIITGAMLAVARVTGETAPLLLTTFLTQSININPFNGPQASLPTYVWDQIGSGTTASIDRAWAGALTLILLVMILNLSARAIARLSRVK
ncbi:unannotated protein [freshwater metagenome]|jgi:phosphate transport system permease protein|uniref:Unannotated protein n=1 Tax=freshwater metagenome TaxID=449393 RepID=A0A6J7DGW1_9ZZZZ|nr:phosphate ABC transporter permease PstA [Actinomycetota bacterium]